MMGEGLLVQSGRELPSPSPLLPAAVAVLAANEQSANARVPVSVSQS